MWWRLLVGAMLAGGLVMAALSAPRAAEGDRYPPTHQLTVCRPGAACEAHGRPSGETACLLNATSDRWMGDLPAGTHIYCRKVTR